MLVSHKHKFIFLKTRKTAGTSAEMFLQPLCMPEGAAIVEQTHTIETAEGIIGRRLIKPKDRTEADKTWFNHMQAPQVKTQIGAEKWDEYTKMATVRNPFDRMVSFYHYSLSVKNASTAETFSELKTNFAHFVKYKDWGSDAKVVHVDGKYIPNYTVRFETLSEDLSSFVKSLGVETGSLNLTSTKSTKKTRKSYAISDYFDTETINIVQNRMKWVFDNFDYPSEPV